ncbi:DNRLRE domain-containing protein [Emticicia agri]|uniref:DNRLRE domain-containing protein n=1 Tax=Emticicia agri TaxID=2492393 RepID=A0A4Q5LWV1_9BACT|nr:DNRLRE domain-containing protein [Emticicia agri]RYU94059.1 DNRLRE domain-containing protein [Emticicia agri]
MKVSKLMLLFKKSDYFLFTMVLTISLSKALAFNSLPDVQNLILNKSSKQELSVIIIGVDSVCKGTACVPYVITKTVSNSNCVNCLQLQPNKTFSKEATISSYIPDENRSSSILDIGGVTQTNSGIPNITRTLLDFDLTNITQGTEIKRAELHLYGHPNTTIGVNMPPNELEIYRITSSWDQNTVTWSTQPTFDSNVKVTLSSSTEDYANYIVDITSLVQNYLNDKSNSFGFILKLVDETPYRRLIFASSKSNNPSMYPKLIIYKK